jgi:polyphenol oxidase
VSAAPYSSANLAVHVGDRPEAVTENRRRLAAGFDAAELGIGDASTMVWLRQVHGDTVVVAGAGGGRVAAPEAGRSEAGGSEVDVSESGAPEADAAVTDRLGVALVVQVADCAPIALVGERTVGVVHAGWAGLEAGVIERAVDALRALDQRDADVATPVRAVLGPCIHPAHYEFGAADLERLVARFGPHVAGVTHRGTPALDLPAAVMHELARVGVHEIVDVDVCTAESPHHFSYRRDGITGRQVVVVVRTT